MQVFNFLKFTGGVGFIYVPNSKNRGITSSYPSLIFSNTLNTDVENLSKRQGNWSFVRSKKVLCDNHLSKPITPLQSSLFRCSQNFLTNIQLYMGFDPTTRHPRKKVVFLGSGWASEKFLKYVDVTKYDVTVISKRDHLTFTPFLTSVCGGTMRPTTTILPITTILKRANKNVIKFRKAEAIRVDPLNKFVTYKTDDEQEAGIGYDYLIVGVGSEINTFNIPGVDENAHFCKEYHQAQAIHSKIIDLFNEAASEKVSDEEKKQLLHIVVAGAGPTGIECAASINDLISCALKEKYPELIKYAKVSIVEMAPNVLSMFGEKVSNYTEKHFEKNGIDCILNHRVISVDSTSITLEKTRKEENGPKTITIPYGLLIWASGIKQNEFVKKIYSEIPDQSHFKSLTCDPLLRVKGAPDIYVIGDALTVKPWKLEDIAETLYTEAKGLEYGAGTQFLKSKVEFLKLRYPQIHEQLWSFPEINKNHMTLDEFKDYIISIDKNYKSPGPTAQCATQESEYLVSVFNSCNTPDERDNAPAFNEIFKGRLAFVGNGEAVINLPMLTITGGLGTGLFWNILYMSMLFSSKNRFDAIQDYYRKKAINKTGTSNMSIFNSCLTQPKRK